MAAAEAAPCACSTTRDGIAAEIEAEIRAAIAFAESSPFPEPDDLYTDMPAES